MLVVYESRRFEWSWRDQYRSDRSERILRRNPSRLAFPKGSTSLDLNAADIPAEPAYVAAAHNLVVARRNQVACTGLAVVAGIAEREAMSVVFLLIAVLFLTL